jgi:hypothetical protein
VGGSVSSSGLSKRQRTRTDSHARGLLLCKASSRWDP